MPNNRQVCLVGSNDYESILKCLNISKTELSDSLSAIEFMDWESYSMALDYLQMEDPIRDHKFKFYMMVEMSGNMEDE
jgi:hypothetical protein